MHYKSARNAGIGVWAPKGTTVKVIVQKKIQKGVIVFSYIFRNFWVAPRNYEIKDLADSR
jgi:hypothetical protein